MVHVQSTGLDPRRTGRTISACARFDVADLVPTLVVAIVSLAGASVVVAVLQQLGLQNASAVYLLAVVATALVGRSVGAVGAAIASFLLYDFLFVEPRLTFTVSDPGEWLNLPCCCSSGSSSASSRRSSARGRTWPAPASVRPAPCSGQPATRDATVHRDRARGHREGPARRDADGARLDRAGGR